MKDRLTICVLISLAAALMLSLVSCHKSVTPVVPQASSPAQPPVAARPPAAPQAPVVAQPPAAAQPAAAAQAGARGQAPAGRGALAAGPGIPRMADGKPDLSGVWQVLDN